MATPARSRRRRVEPAHIILVGRRRLARVAGRGANTPRAGIARTTGCARLSDLLAVRRRQLDDLRRRRRQAQQLELIERGYRHAVRESQRSSCRQECPHDVRRPRQQPRARIAQTQAEVSGCDLSSHGARPAGRGSHDGRPLSGSIARRGSCIAIMLPVLRAARAATGVGPGAPPFGPRSARVRGIGKSALARVRGYRLAYTDSRGRRQRRRQVRPGDPASTSLNLDTKVPPCPDLDRTGIPAHCGALATARSCRSRGQLLGARARFAGPRLRGCVGLGAVIARTGADGAAAPTGACPSVPSPATAPCRASASTRAAALPSSPRPAIPLPPFARAPRSGQPAPSRGCPAASPRAEGRQAGSSDLSPRPTSTDVAVGAARDHA
jgi:hypothetical protein